MPIRDHQPEFRAAMVLWGGIGLGVLTVLLLLTHGFGMWGETKGSDAEPAWVLRQGDKIIVPDGSPLRSRITVLPAATEAVSARLVIPGVVEPDPARAATILPQLTGRVVNLKVRLGDRVSQGAVLVVLDSADLAQAYSDFNKAEDALRLTQRTLERQIEQARIGVASDKDLDQAKSDNAQVQSEYQRAVARLRVLNAPLESHGSARQLIVRAPFDGTVTTLNIAPGSTVNDSTQPMMTIVDLSTIWVTALVPENRIAALVKNQEAEIRLVAYPERPLHGRVLFIGDIVEPDSRRTKIRIALSNADYLLKPNMFATVTLLGPAKSQIVVPSSALLMDNDRTSVFVATAPWEFARRSVDAELADGPLVGIQGGIAAGDQVVVKGAILLND